jgi:hypothetical protein
MKKSLQLSKVELKMINEVFEVFSKYKTDTRKFAVQLDHTHFNIGSDEILLETNNTLERTLKVRTVKLKQIGLAQLATAWHRNEHGDIEVCMFCCDAGDVDTDEPINE